jgi:type I restriction enzyme M protein
MNMILHDFPHATIMNGNTLHRPQFKEGERLRTFDYVVANPPFSDKAWTQRLRPPPRPLRRFAWGVPPPRTATTPSCCTS